MANGPGKPLGGTPSDGGEPSTDLAADRFLGVPLFPLPNVVLFPRAVLPLHIFEERYKVMTADALAGDKLIAMALLRTGWEKNYYGKAAIERVVCLGQILTHEQLDDGKYNFLLQGVCRATVTGEHSGKPYRVVDLERVSEAPAIEMSLDDQRRRLTDLLRADVAAFLPGAQQFLQMLSSPLPTAAIADLIAFHLLDDVPLKQSILAEADVRKRVVQTAAALAAMHPPVAKVRYTSGPSWN
jgi:Lon protease-like protein